MQKVSSVIVLSLAAAVGAATLVLSNSDPDSDPDQDQDQDSSTTDTVVATSQFDSNAATEQRILALESAISEERRSRQLLEDELLILFAELEQLQANREDSETEPVARTQQLREERQTSGRRDAMIAAGMSPDRADYILRRESEMRYEQMQAVYEARSSGEPLDPFRRNFNADAMLREEIGDTEYETYLEANNRSTSVGVSSVMASSPGEQAGLRAGDEIVGYDGQRVFSTSELIQQTMAGGDGNVVVDLMRDGSPMQIVVPRGPIGVEVGRFRGR